MYLVLGPLCTLCCEDQSGSLIAATGQVPLEDDVKIASRAVYQVSIHTATASIFSTVEKVDSRVTHNSQILSNVSNLESNVSKIESNVSKRKEKFSNLNHPSGQGILFLNH